MIILCACTALTKSYEDKLRGKLSSPVPDLQNRTLIFHPDFPGPIYPFEVEECFRHGPLKVIKKCVMNAKTDRYDLNDPTTRKMLYDMRFECRSPMNRLNKPLEE